MRYLTVPCIFFISLSIFPSLAYPSDSCECDFDTTKYTAKCSCYAVCAVTTKNSRECKITCDGKSETKEGDTKLYGALPQFRENIEKIMNQIYKKGLNAYYDASFIKYAMPRLIRTSYLSADFLSDFQAIKIDQIINYIFKINWNRIKNSLRSDTSDKFSLDTPFHNKVEVQVSKFKLFIKLQKIEEDNFTMKVLLYPLER